MSVVCRRSTRNRTKAVGVQSVPIRSNPFPPRYCGANCGISAKAPTRHSAGLSVPLVRWVAPSPDRPRAGPKKAPTVEAFYEEPTRL